MAAFDSSFDPSLLQSAGEFAVPPIPSPTDVVVPEGVAEVMSEVGDFTSRYATWDFWKYVVCFATAIGAFGGFPESPKIFKWLASWKIFQWFLVFVLLYQGGSGEDALFSLLVTGIVAIIYYAIKFAETFVVTSAPSNVNDDGETT